MILCLVFFFFSKTPSTIATNHWVSHGTVCIFCAHRVENRRALRETERSAVTALRSHLRPRGHSPTFLRCCSCFSKHVPSAYRRHPPCPEPGQPPASEKRGISEGQSFPPVSTLSGALTSSASAAEEASGASWDWEQAQFGFGRALMAEPIKHLVNQHHSFPGEGPKRP